MSPEARRLFRLLARQLSTNALHAVQCGLETDDPAILQGMSSFPADLPGNGGLHVSFACVLGYAALADGCTTVAEVAAFVLDACVKADAEAGQGGAVKAFLNWYDDADRKAMRRELLAEVAAAIAKRTAVAA